MRPVGVLALQGGFARHLEALARIGAPSREVRRSADLRGLSGLILPGGESSVMLSLIAREGLEPALRGFEGPILATCAGLILAAKTVSGPAQASLGLLDVHVARNAYGPQLDSFVARDDSGAHPLVFIRAPRIVAVGRDVRVRLTRAGEPVMVESGRVLGAAFHPELAGDDRFHRELFLGQAPEEPALEPIPAPSPRSPAEDRAHRWGRLSPR